MVRNMTGTVLDSEEIPAGANLKRRFALAMLHWMDASWQLGEFSSAGTFFCTRGNEKRMVGIQPTEPGHAPDPGSSRLQSCSSCGV